MGINGNDKSPVRKVADTPFKKVGITANGKKQKWIPDYDSRE
jgi:hypothetical protein